MLSAHELYLAATTAKIAKKPRRLTYRCESHKCLLLDVIDAGPLGVVLHKPRYKYSETQNQARSNESGRKAHTVDGNRRWTAQTFYLNESGLNWDMPEVAGQGLSCDHVLEYMLSPSVFQSDWANSVSNVRIRSNNSRYTV